MTKQEILSKLENIKDKIDGWDIINKNGLDEIRDDITTIQWQINLNMGD